MKNIDIKSLIIGVLLTTTVFFGMGATGKADAGKWDDKQEWLFATDDDLEALGLLTRVRFPTTKQFEAKTGAGIIAIEKVTGGWEPYAKAETPRGINSFRKRAK